MTEKPNKEKLLKLQLSKFDFDVNEMDYIDVMREFGRLYDDGNYLDACELAKEFLFKFAMAKYIQFELQRLHDIEPETMRVDPSVADF